MADTTFTNGVTLTDADWFNDVNRLHYTIFSDPADADDVRQALWVKGTDTASAATVTLPGDGNYIHITGTTTITGFGAVSSGYRIKVVFDGSLTLTHNATSFILPGSTSIITNANDVAEFVNESGSNWRCTGYISTSAQGVPAGAMMPYGGSAAPSGWLLCYGQAVSRTTYAGLFAAISTAFGVGDGSTTFNVPDLRGRAPFGKDDMGGSAASRITNGVSGITGTTLGASGGDENSQSHSHTFTGTGVNLSTTGGGVANQLASGSSSTVFTSFTPAGSNSTYGSGSSENMPPALITNYIIRT